MYTYINSPYWRKMHPHPIILELRFYDLMHSENASDDALRFIEDAILNVLENNPGFPRQIPVLEVNITDKNGDRHRCTLQYKVVGHMGGLCLSLI